MAIIRKIKYPGSTNRVYVDYIVYLWGKEIKVSCIESEKEVSFIPVNFENKCPKCNEPYPEPRHGDMMICSGCGAEFQFFGALHPKPIGKTLRAVERAIGWR